MKLNHTQRRALDDAIGNVQDDLCRTLLQLKLTPDDEKLKEHRLHLLRKLDELTEGITHV